MYSEQLIPIVMPKEMENYKIAFESLFELTTVYTSQPSVTFCSFCFPFAHPSSVRTITAPPRNIPLIQLVEVPKPADSKSSSGGLQVLVL